MTVQALGSLVRIELDDRAPAAIIDAWGDARVAGPHTASSPATTAPEPATTAPEPATVETTGDTVDTTAGTVDGVSATQPLVITATTPDDPGDGFGDGLASQVTLAAIEALRGRALMFHACALALPDGRVIGFVGPSGRGKTTLARSLGRHYGYVTDETLAVLPGGTVLPYRKPLSIGRRPGVKQTIAPSALGLQPLPAAPLRLAAIVLLDRREGATTPVVSTVPLAEAIAELAPETSSLGALPSPLRTLAGELQRTGGVRRLTYGDIEHLTDPIPDILVAEAPPEPYEMLAVEHPEASDGTAALPAGSHRRAAADEALAVGDDILVRGDGRITLLTGIGPVLWRAADGADAEVLAARAREDMPPPPDGIDADQLIAQALEALVQSGLVVRG